MPSPRSLALLSALVVSFSFRAGVDNPAMLLERGWDTSAPPRVRAYA